MSNKKSGRIRRLGFLAVVVGIGAALSLAGFAPALAKSPRPIKWLLQSCWTAGDFHQTNPQNLAKIIEEMSGGRLKINVMAAGAIVPSFEVLDAVNKGIIDAGNSWPGYWMGKHPAAALFSSMVGGPFGLNSEDFLGWVYRGGGLELYNEMLQKELKLNVISFPTSGEAPEPQGWFPKPLKSVKDFKGLKFRAAGMSAEVFKEMGMSVVTLSGGEIVPGLERGVIDCAEYSDPSSDMRMGFQDVRKYYHMPGIHQPTGFLELIINKKKWDALPADLKAIVKYGVMATGFSFDISMLDKNSEDLKTLIDKHGVTVVQTPREIMLETLKAWDKVAERQAKKNPFFAKVLESQRKWAKKVVPYRRVAHPPYDLAADFYWGDLNPYKVMKP
ncbi:MAG: TRAP transporter substrate-binding protein [Deltaproteobacteria bacterium]|nr:TRAP transporter substrate-binding protein [Deltaproteobacteria bacterium]